MVAVYSRTDRDSDFSVAINKLVDRDAGNASGGQQVRWTQYDGTELNAHGGGVTSSGNYTHVLRSTAGKHRSTLLAATTATAAPTPANAVELVDDTGLSIGAGKALRVYGAGGSSYSQLAGDNTGMLTLSGSGGAAGSLRLPNNTGINGRNAADSADVAIASIGTDDVLYLGGASAQTSLLGTTVAALIDPPTLDGQVTAASQCKGYFYGLVSGGTLFPGNQYNVASSVRNAAGDFTLTWGLAFTSVNYACLVTVQGAVQLQAQINAKTATTATVFVMTAAGVKTDPDGIHVVAFGVLA
jgi:hypothetical protein